MAQKLTASQIQSLRYAAEHSPSTLRSANAYHGQYNRMSLVALHKKGLLDIRNPNNEPFSDRYVINDAGRAALAEAS